MHHLLIQDATLLPALPPSSIHITITSPPYNLNMPYPNTLDTDNIALPEYLDFTRLYLQALYQVTKPAGRLCLNVPLDTAKPARTPLYSHILQAALAVGWLYNTTIIWSSSHNTRRTAWGSYCSPSAPQVTTNAETIIVLYKPPTFKRPPPISATSHIGPQYFIEWSDGLWHDLPAETKPYKQYPAAFHTQLPSRLLQLYAYHQDTILDPFHGSGTTGIAAHQLGYHNFIGSDHSPHAHQIQQWRYNEHGYIFATTPPAFNEQGDYTTQLVWSSRE